MDELVSSCRNPELELKYEESDELVSAHATLADANDTLGEMLASVDEFVSKTLKKISGMLLKKSLNDVRMPKSRH